MFACSRRSFRLDSSRLLASGVSRPCRPKHGRRPASPVQLASLFWLLPRAAALLEVRFCSVQLQITIWGLLNTPPPLMAGPELVGIAWLCQGNESSSTEMGSRGDPPCAVWKRLLVDRRELFLLCGFRQSVATVLQYCKRRHGSRVASSVIHRAWGSREWRAESCRTQQGDRARRFRDECKYILSRDGAAKRKIEQRRDPRWFGGLLLAGAVRLTPASRCRNEACECAGG